MAFSWNKWRQYIIEEASVNEIDSRERETLGLFKFAVKLGVLEPQDYDDLEKVAMDPDAYEEGLDFNAIEAVKINKALTKIFNIIDPSVSTSASQIYDKLKGGEELDGYDLGNALQIYNRFQDQEAGNTSPEDLDAAAGKFDSLEENKFDKPGWDLKAIMDDFIESFEVASKDPDDIPYAQKRVVDAYKDVFAKSHPQLAGEIDAYLEDRDRTERRRIFQNAADDPEVVGRDMMSEVSVVDDFEVGDRVALNVAYQKAGGNERKIPSEFKFTVVGVREVPKGGGGTYQDVSVERWENRKPIRKSYDNTQLARIEDQEVFGELEGEVQTEVDAFDEAMNDMAIERATTATKLSDFQNDRENDLTQEELDIISDAIVLLRRKETVVNENQEDLDKNYFALAHEMGLKDLRPSPEAITDKWYERNVERDLKANDVTVKDFDWVLKYFVRKGADRKKIHDLQDKVYFKARENSTAKNREMFSYLYDKDGKLKPEYKNR